MNNLETVDLCDFYFNGNYLSDFGGIVAGKDGWKEYNLLPSRSDKTQKTINTDGEYLIKSTLNPRAFSIPIYWEDLSDSALRDIAGWLDSEEPTLFYIKNSSIGLYCKLDPSDVSVQTACNLTGLSELKFIAYSPFFIEVSPDQITLSASTVIVNLGNKICFPKIEIVTASPTTVELHFYQNAVEYAFFSLTDLEGYAVMDCAEYTIENLSGESLEDHLSQSVGDSVYPYIRKGTTTIVLIGNNITSVKITPNFMWI